MAIIKVDERLCQLPVFPEISVTWPSLRVLTNVPELAFVIHMSVRAGCDAAFVVLVQFQSAFLHSC